ERARTSRSLDELRPLRDQGLASVELRIDEDRVDLVEPHAELAIEQDLLQSFEVRPCVEPVPRPAARGRPKQADRVVVVQRADADSRDLRELADRERRRLHALRSTASRRVRVKAERDLFSPRTRRSRGRTTSAPPAQVPIDVHREPQTRDDTDLSDGTD